MAVETVQLVLHLTWEGVERRPGDTISVEADVARQLRAAGYAAPAGAVLPAPPDPYPQYAMDVGLAETVAAATRVALRRFWQSLANRAAAPCDVLVMGHSFVEGVAATSWQKSFTAALRDALRTRFPVPGVVGGYGYKTRDTIPFADDPVALVGGAIISGVGTGYGLGRKRIFLANTSQKATWTNITCTGFDIFWTRTPATATFDYAVDGGAPVTFSGVGVDAAGMVTQVRGLAAGLHTVEVGMSVGVGNVEGLMIYNGDETKGIRMWGAGYSSTGTPAWVDAANLKWLQDVGVVQPSLVVLSMISNDWYGPTAPGGTRVTVTAAQTEANLLTLIASLKSTVTADPSIVICTEWPYGTGVANSSEPFSAYQAAVDRVVAAEPLACRFDLGDRVVGGGAPPVGHPLVNADRIHPNDAGMQAWADAFTAFVAPR
jgi:lysophospholipase L1-like esterase